MSDPLRILVVDDESAMRHMLRLLLVRAGYEVRESENGRQALDLLQEHPCDILLCDVRMPQLGGLELLDTIRTWNTVPTVIMMTAYGSIDLALDCMKRGAYDYISKPFKPDEVVLTLRKAEERLGLQRENQHLRKQLGAENGGHTMVYRSAAIARVVDLVQKAAPSSSAVLITGETGTGKELVARALHRHSGRPAEKFFSLNCSAVPDGLLESELFGHVRGAFSGAERDRDGLFLAADGGTLFLDEIADLPLHLQPKLLRVLQEGEVRRIGETQSRHVATRILAATAVDLKKAVAEGRFREDLFYRLNVVEIALPALRERPEDIAPLTEHFLAQFARREKRPVPRFSPESLDILEKYSWPGNIRELGNFVERTLIFCRDKIIGLDSLPWEIRRDNRNPAEISLKNATARLEKEFIRKALARTGGNRTHAARLLEISLRALIYKIKEYEIE